MTGYGKVVLQLPNKKITLEVKSLNSKNLDLNSRVPGSYREKEMLIRNTVAKKLVRGKIDVNLFVELTGENTNTNINRPVVNQYMEQLKELVDGDPVELLKMAVRLPDALHTEREEIDEDEFGQIMDGINQAIEALQQFRKTEGEALEVDFRTRVSNIRSILQQVIELDPERVAQVRERLQKALNELKENVDQNRFEQELIYYLEKYDITEEHVRLNNHLDYFEKTLATPDSNGKKLGFISQEMGREINTIGSKANYAPMQQLVVQMKDELEKIKEQSLNVL